MKALFYLKSCSTCQRIIDAWQPPKEVLLVDIKSTPLGQEQLEAMYQRSESYEALFSKRARLYQERGLKNQVLEEKDYKALILENYTFLKRPVLIWENKISIGNSKKSVVLAREWIHGSEKN
ncbi:MAG: arsenate reductase family protein [Flavobacteriaceae bacterium]